MTESICQMFLYQHLNWLLIGSPRIGSNVKMSSKVKKKILKLKESSTLIINEKSKELISKGKKVYQFGFGQSPFPVPEKIVEAKKEFDDQISKNPYICPIPDGVMPPISKD